MRVVGEFHGLEVRWRHETPEEAAHREASEEFEQWGESICARRASVTKAEVSRTIAAGVTAALILLAVLACL